MRSDSDFVSRGSLGALRRGLIAGALCVAAAAMPAQAINVYIMSSGDASLDAAVQDLLTSYGHASTIGPRISQFDGSDSLVNVDAVFMQGSTGGNMPELGQLMLRDWVVAGGGGLVTSEPVLDFAHDGRFQSLQAIFPAETTGVRYGSDPSLTLAQVADDPILTAGLPTTFSFPASGGTDCLPSASHSDAIGFYQATTTSFVTSALVGGSAGNGFVVNIGPDIGINQIADANFGRLIVNALVWASSGELTPGVDLGVHVAAPSCQVRPYTVTVRIVNFGSEISGPVALTVDLPSTAVATYAGAIPLPTTVSPATLTFELPPLIGAGDLADVSITLVPSGAGGTASITATAATAADIDLSNNGGAAFTIIPSTASGVHLEVGDAPELAGGQQPDVGGALMVIEGTLTSEDADMYMLRVVDWAAFQANTSIDPIIVNVCGGEAPSRNTSLFLFDAAGGGIAFNDDGGIGSRAFLEPGNPLYAHRTDGEIVWLAIAGRRDPISGGAVIWADLPLAPTRGPDGLGAGGWVDAWTGSGGQGAYRIELAGVESAVHVSGTDLGAYVAAPSCSSDSYTVAVRLVNLGASVSGPVTLTVGLPSTAIATFVSAMPPPTIATATTLTFELSPLAGAGVHADVFINLAPITDAPAVITASAVTTADINLSNNLATASTDVRTVSPGTHIEVGDAPELAGGQTPAGTGTLTAIEGFVGVNEYADLYRIRVDDWSIFGADTSLDPSSVCGGPRDISMLFLFDATGLGIAANIGGGTGTGFRGFLEPGNLLYADRTDGEIVWLGISTGMLPESGDDLIWSFPVTVTTYGPDGPGAGSVVDSWRFPGGAPGSYRISLSGVSFPPPPCPADMDGSGMVDVFDLLAYLDLWFVSNPAADLDANATIDVFDLLAYLEAWFTGC